MELHSEKLQNKPLSFQKNILKLLTPFYGLFAEIHNLMGPNYCTIYYNQIALIYLLFLTLMKPQFHLNIWMAIPMIFIEQKLFVAKVIKIDGIKDKQYLSFIYLQMVYKGYNQSLFSMVLLALLDRFTSKRATAIAKKLQLLIMKLPTIMRSFLISGLLKSCTHYLLIAWIIFLLWMWFHFTKH